jgi:hypothetical protein
MPRCVLNENCQFPGLALRVGHKCPRCFGSVHVLCGQEDPDATDLHLNVTCNACLGMVSKARTPLATAEPEAATRATEETATKEQQKEKTKETTTMKKKAPPKKKTSRPKKHQQSLDLAPTRLKKSAAGLSFRLKAASGEQDPYIMKSVCFSLDDPGGYGKQLADHFGGIEKIEKSLVSLDDQHVYLFGNIVRETKLPKEKGNAKVTAYDVEWEDLVLGETKIDLQVLVPAIELSLKIRRREKMMIGGSGKRDGHRKYRPDKLFGNEIVHSLFAVHEGEDGIPYDSDSTTADDDDDEDENKEDDDDDGLLVNQGQRGVTTREEETYLEEEVPTPDCSRFKWRAGEHIIPPAGKSNRRPTVVKQESVGCFLSPLASFLAFVPFKLIKSIVYYSNIYADSVLAASNSSERAAPRGGAVG